MSGVYTKKCTIYMRCTIVRYVTIWISFHIFGGGDVLENNANCKAHIPCIFEDSTISPLACEN